jgi:hypothetical protein
MELEEGVSMPSFDILRLVGILILRLLTLTAIIKQLTRKCMLFFCHQDQYCLCPYFSLGVYYLFGGLWHETTKETAVDFVFPHLHSLLNDSIAARITSYIRATISNKERKKMCLLD